MANNKDFIVKNGLTVGSDASVSGRVDAGNVTITSTDGGSSAGPDLILYRNSASPNDGDYLGQIQFKGRNDGPGDEIYAKVTGKISDSTNGIEDGLIETAIKGNGTFTIVSRQKSNELQLINGVGLSVNGSITVDGTVDGRDIATDGSKLDGIESGATADQSASEILTLIKTVDGSGSGLDADTLDGIQSASFSTNNYITNHYTSNNYIQTFVAAQVASVVDSAPATLDTLNELAAALGNNANFSTTVSTQIGLRATNTYVNSTFSSNNYVTGNFVSNNYLTSGQISNINVSQLQVGEEDSAAGGLLTVYGRQTGDSVGGEIRLHTAADYDTNIPYYAIKTSGEDFIIELNGGTDVITIDYSSGAVDIPTGVLEVGVSDSQYGIIHVHGDHTGSSLGGFVRIYSPADYDSTINYYNIKVYQDDFIMEKSNGVNIFTYYGNNGETRFDNPAYVSIGTPDSWYGDLRLHGNGTGSIYGGILRFYTAADHDATVDYFNMRVIKDDWHFERNTGEDIISFLSSNNELVLGTNTNVSGTVKATELQVGENDSQRGVLSVYGDGTGQYGGGEIRVYTSADYDTNIDYWKLQPRGDDFVIERDDGTDFLRLDYSNDYLDVPLGRMEVGASDTTYGEIRLYGNGTGSSQGGLIRMYTAADYDSSIDFFNMKVTADDWHLEKSNGDDILSYFGGSNELRFGSTLAYVSVGASDSSKGSLYLWSDGTGSVNGGELRIYNAPDHDTNVNYYSIYAESGDLLISYGSTDFLQYDETASQWLMPRSGGLDVTGPVTAATYNLASGGVLVSNNYFQDNAGGGATGGGSDKIFHNNDQTVTTSYTIPSGQNSMTAGPISINSGVTVTVPSGSEWTIV